jgi:putative flavoprotein involved in K+ transport
MAAGVERVVGRVVGGKDGQPILDDGRIVQASNIVWCTGFQPDFDWVTPSVVDSDGWPRQRHGIATDLEGLYFVGLPFLHSAASSLLGGVGRDASHVAEHVATRVRRVAATATSSRVGGPRAAASARGRPA